MDQIFCEHLFSAECPFHNAAIYHVHILLINTDEQIVHYKWCFCVCLYHWFSQGTGQKALMTALCWLSFVEDLIVRWTSSPGEYIMKLEMALEFLKMLNISINCHWGVNIFISPVAFPSILASIFCVY